LACSLAAPRVQSLRLINNLSVYQNLKQRGSLPITSNLHSAISLLHSPIHSSLTHSLTHSLTVTHLLHIHTHYSSSQPRSSLISSCPMLPAMLARSPASSRCRTRNSPRTRHAPRASPASPAPPAPLPHTLTHSLPNVLWH
jgi:hypothetical protein